MQEEILKGADPRVFLVEANDEFEDERVFVLAKGLWYERIEGQTGAVEFTPIAQDEYELRERLAASMDEDELIEADDEFGAEVIREFMEQTPLYPEAPELSTQWE